MSQQTAIDVLLKILIVQRELEALRDHRALGTDGLGLHDTRGDASEKQIGVSVPARCTILPHGVFLSLLVRL
jgi:hypothetical protein